MAKRNGTASSKRGGQAVAAILILFLLLGLPYLNKKDAPNAPEAPRKERTVRTKKVKRAKELRTLSTFTGKVISIKDGDTFEVLYDSIPERIRLAEIDCPEKKQAFGMRAKQFASDLCFGKTVTVINTGRDRYGRIIGKITTQEGINVNEEMVKAGFAWHYKQYSDNAQLDEYEQQAREKHLGLWADSDPTPPWDYRRTKRTKR